MEYRNLGKSGLKISRLCSRLHELWRAPTRGPIPGRSMSRRAAPSSPGRSNWASTSSTPRTPIPTAPAKRFWAEPWASFARRDEVVIATKVYHPMRKDANARGLSRKTIFTEIDASLRRLGTDYVDLYQIHRWDYTTPIEETLDALADVVRAGKARYLGASSMFAWQFCQALHLADQHGWPRFISMQDHYNLLYREEEREMFPLCRDQHIGIIPWSPLARGRLARPWETEPSTPRAETDEFTRTLYSKTEDADRLVVDRVGEIAAARGVPRAQIALAWVLANPLVTAPIIGATKPHHLEDALAALTLQLSSDEVAALEAPYIPHPVAGFA